MHGLLRSPPFVRFICARMWGHRVCQWSDCLPRSSHTPPVSVPPRPRESSPPLLPVWMNVYFLFPWCWISLPFHFLSGLVVQGGAVCLPTPPSWFSPPVFSAPSPFLLNLPLILRHISQSPWLTDKRRGVVRDQRWDLLSTHRVAMLSLSSLGLQPRSDLHPAEPPGVHVSGALLGDSQPTPGTRWRWLDPGMGSLEASTPHCL